MIGTAIRLSQKFARNAALSHVFAKQNYRSLVHRATKVRVNARKNLVRNALSFRVFVEKK
jgi:hypothetical protein